MTFSIVRSKEQTPFEYQDLFWKVEDASVGQREKGKIKWKVRGRRRVQNPVLSIITPKQHLRAGWKWLTSH